MKPAILLKVEKTEQLMETIRKGLKEYQSLLPASKGAKILIKPNLNSNMNALTGNTTDLRLLAGVISFLQDKGYRNIAIGEGTNSGFYRNKINVISRLKVDLLAKHYNVKVVDLNYSSPVEVEFDGGIKAGVAKDVVHADFLINLPKLKTHFEAGISVCLKNLMGCLVGQENKKKTHKRLGLNILNLNRAVRPHLHIVDGLIGMEGLGPTRGKPVRMNTIIMGTDPVLIDMICADITGFSYKEVWTLRLAEEQGIITKEHRNYVKRLDLSPFRRPFEKPAANVLVRFIHSPGNQPFFLAIRNTSFFNYLASTRLFGYLLFISGLRQDNFIHSEMSFTGLSLEREKCTECNRCRDYCPVSLSLPRQMENGLDGCIECLYCYLVCPEKAITFKGELGFVGEQMRQYDDVVRSIT